MINVLLGSWVAPVATGGLVGPAWVDRPAVVAADPCGSGAQPPRAQVDQ
jgi:hypothetical protein